jgi:hypothetical protein
LSPNFGILNKSIYFYFQKIWVVTICQPEEAECRPGNADVDPGHPNAGPGKLMSAREAEEDLQ